MPPSLCELRRPGKDGAAASGMNERLYYRGMAPSVTISARGEQRVRAGHPWIYRTDVVEVDAQAGDLVQVLGPRRRGIGHALFSDRSQIAIRMLSRGDGPLDDSVVRIRIDAAFRYRESLQLDASAYRVVHGEADLLPSLVVDKYGDYLVVQTLSQGMDRLLPTIVRDLIALIAPAGVLARNDPKVRALEGLPQTVDVLHGTIPDSVLVREGPVEYTVDLMRGQKTGLFLDQRENREAAARYAHGRLLDCFSYHGGFALRLARQCSDAEAVDISADAVARIRTNAERNSVQHLRATEANVFDELRRHERAGDRYDTIVLDPPAFAKNKASVPNALAGYKEINLRALKLLVPGGVLITCSCSYHVQEPLFQELLEAAAADARVTVSLVEKRTQARDHPVLLGVPETQYLKCFVLRRLS
jgi:23S rRNA (cytosine1962-C5)-methyltransferase